MCTKKSDCHLHTTLKQRLSAVYKLRFQHNIKTLCRVLNVNRSTYYKDFYSLPSSRTIENQNIKQMILHIYADYDKRIGAYKIINILGRDYGIHIRVVRVYRLMRSMQLPPMSTIKPKSISSPKESSVCHAYHLHQGFYQKAPNLVWTSDFTYFKAGGKWYYLCIIMNLFSRKR